LFRFSERSETDYFSLSEYLNPARGRFGFDATALASVVKPADQHHYLAHCKNVIYLCTQDLPRVVGERKRPPRGWESLTPTELQVVKLVAEGLTNPQIGERMFISRGTVKAHLSHVFAKLAISSRAELAAEATRRGVEAPADPAKR
jgi:DNA-binding NarL/FixJ family response regulator